MAHYDDGEVAFGHPNGAEGHPQEGRIRYRPDRFDGLSSWRDYETHFEECAYLNQWSDDDKAMFLRVSMTGTARQVVTDLVRQRPPDQPPTYNDLLQALRCRFHHACQQELYRAKLVTCERANGESLPALASRIRRDVELAYPTYNSVAREDQCLEKFLSAIADVQVRLQVRSHRPTTLDSAVGLAMELESYAARCSSGSTCERARYRPPVRATVAHPEPDVPLCSTSVPAKDDRVSKVDDALVERFQAVLEKALGKIMNGKRCYECNSPDHLARDCALRRRQNSTRNQTSFHRGGNGQRPSSSYRQGQGNGQRPT